MTATVFMEAQHPFDGLIEAHHQLSIDEVIIAQNQTILVGAVLGSIGVTGDMTLTGAATLTNVGTTTIGSISGTSQSQNGVYNIVQLVTSATGQIEVTRPDGTLDGIGKVGTAYAGSIHFTLTAGGTETAGDSWTVTVTRPFDEGGEQFEAWSPGATDGSQNAVAIALYPAVTASGQTKKIAALRRDGAFRASAATFASSSFTGSISSTTLTVSAMAPGSGPILPGTTVNGAGVSANSVVAAYGTSSTTGIGGVGTYVLSQSSTVSSAESMTAAPAAAQQAFAVQQLVAKDIVMR